MAMPTPVVLFGGSGQLGERISKQWSDLKVLAPPKSVVDVRDRAGVKEFISVNRPGVVINAIAFNDVPGAEANPSAAFELNAVGVDTMAEACSEASCTFVTFSTDYVFDGKLGRAYIEADSPAPINAYGVSKYAGELLALRFSTQTFVVRTCGLYGIRVSSSKGYSFVDRILRQAYEGKKEIAVVDDQTVSPTYAGHLASALRTLLDSQATAGVYHAVNEGAITWFEFARELVKQAGFKTHIERASSSEFTGIRRPRYSALENAKLRALSITLPDWRAGVSAYLHDKDATYDV